MSSVTPLIEYGEHKVKTENEVETERALEGLGEFSLGGLGKLKDLPPLAASHASLTRTLWIRRLLERALATRTYKVVQSWDITEGGAKAASYGEMAFKLDRPMDRNEIPWMTAAFKSYGTFSMWGETAKMACPSFDLPAGGAEAGGACPGADAGQSIISYTKRMTQLSDVDGNPLGCSRDGNPLTAYIPNVPPGERERVALRERDTICSQCYATAGNYPSPHVQAAEIIRYWWCKSMLAAGRTQEWVDTVVRSMQLLKYPWYRSGIMPVRIHSSGDFFSPAYARAWVQVANRIWALDRRIVMWAPTRSWAAAGWGDEAGSTEAKWREIFGQLVSARERPELPNLVLRASAYHVGDNAPGQMVPGTRGTARFPVVDRTGTRFVEHEHELLVGGTAVGTTSLLAEGAGRPTAEGPDFRANRGADDYRRDFDCGVYAEGAGAHDCNAAFGIDGQRGCRVCWTHPQVRVNFTTH